MRTPDFKPSSLSVKAVAFGILQPLTFQLAPGHTMAVIGANGAGKSTLLKLLYRLYRPTRGQVLIDGTDLHRLHHKIAAQRIAAVIQEQPSQFALSVLDVLKLGLLPRQSLFSRIADKQQTIIDDIVELLSLQQLLKRACHQLSGGERQRVMIGRALIQQPGLLILDEPTNHLDIRYQLELLALLRELNITTVVALHDLNLANDYTDEVLILHQGLAIAKGPTAQVLNSEHIRQAFAVDATRHHSSEFFTFSLPEHRRPNGVRPITHTPAPGTNCH